MSPQAKLDRAQCLLVETELWLNAIEGHIAALQDAGVPNPEEIERLRLERLAYQNNRARFRELAGRLTVLHGIASMDGAN